MIAEILPEAFFKARIDAGQVWLLWLMAMSAVFLLVYGADKAVSSAVRMAKAMGLSTVIIGATVVSLGTTAPETCVSVTAAFNGKPGLALGNGIGSIICDTALVFGLACCLVRLPKDKFILKRHGWLQLASGTLITVVILVLAWLNGSINGVTLPRWIGGIFLALLVGYMWISAKWAKVHPEAIPDEAKDGEVERSFKEIAVDLFGLAIGLGLVLIGSDLMVGSVGQICLHYGVPESVLAVTLVAFGTSLPELVTAIASIVKGHPELLVGNVIGADILNVLFVIGASATAVPLQVPPEFFYIHLPVMMVALAMFRFFISFKSEKFSRWQGVPLLLVFAGYYAILMTLVLMGKLEYSPI